MLASTGMPQDLTEENRDRLLFRVTKLLRESRNGAKKVVCTGFSGPRSQPNTREPEFSHRLYCRVSLENIHAAELRQFGEAAGHVLAPTRPSAADYEQSVFYQQRLQHLAIQTDFEKFAPEIRANALKHCFW